MFLQRGSLTTCCLISLTFLYGVAAQSCVPQFGAAGKIITIASASDGHGLSTPRDLMFHPAAEDELWVASADEGGVGSGNYIIKHPGEPEQTTILLQDRISFHYEDNLAAFSFDSTGAKLFTCQESENRYLGLQTGPNWFQGPTAFEVLPCNGGYGKKEDDKDECEVLTVTQQGGEGDNCADEACYLIHSDMLHEAPLCMGMAYDGGAVTGTTGFNSIDERTPGNIVWYLDGIRGKLMRFDFDELHGTAYIDHRYANIRRYVDVDIKRRPGVPGHMIVDEEARVLYVNDVGNGRVLRVAADSGNFIRGAQCVPDACYPDNNNYTCPDTGISHDNSTVCEKACESDCSKDLIDKYQCYAGHCTGGVCAGEDGHGCYTTFTETGDMFEYELWGCTDWDVFTDKVASPSGIVLDKAGRIFISDFDSGVIYAFDKNGIVLAEFQAEPGVTGLEMRCRGMGSCSLWFVNVNSKEVQRLLVTESCLQSATQEPTLPEGRAVVRAGKEKNDPLCSAVPDKTRPNFIVRHGDGYNNRMVVHHAYGKACEGAAVGMMPTGMSEEDQAKCPDRTDCSRMNYDLLVMAGFFCHPCLNNPCDNGGVCTNIAREGFTCDCSSTAGFSGDKCEISPAQCPALAPPPMGALVPAGCTTDTSQPGEQCVLHCDPATSQALLPPEAERRGAAVARTCESTGEWSGGGYVCGCLPGQFGASCDETLVSTNMASGRIVPQNGGAVKLSNGEGVEIPAGALDAAIASNVSVSLFSSSVDLADIGEAGAWTKRGQVMEVLPEGLLFDTPAVLSMSYRPSQVELPAMLSVFYFDNVQRKWVQQEDSVLDMERNLVSVETTHFSRWVLLEKTPPPSVDDEGDDDDDDGLSTGAWVGIGFAIIAGMLLVGAGLYWVCVPVQKPIQPANPITKGVDVVDPGASGANGVGFVNVQAIGNQGADGVGSNGAATVATPASPEDGARYAEHMA